MFTLWYVRNTTLPFTVRIDARVAHSAGPEWVYTDAQKGKRVGQVRSY
jgi:hypothetical protein